MQISEEFSSRKTRQLVAIFPDVQIIKKIVKLLRGAEDEKFL